MHPPYPVCVCVCGGVGGGVVLSNVMEDVGEAVCRNIDGAQLLHELLSSPWLRALLKVRPNSAGESCNSPAGRLHQQGDCLVQMWRV